MFPDFPSLETFRRQSRKLGAGTQPANHDHGASSTRAYLGRDVLGARSGERDLPARAASSNLRHPAAP